MLDSFPACPVTGSSLLKPISCWTQMTAEFRSIEIEYDTFWDESVHDGVAYFFRWFGEPSAIVLAVFDDRNLTHVEARKIGDIELSKIEISPIMQAVIGQFASAGYTYRFTHQH